MNHQKQSMRPVLNGLGMGCLAIVFGFPLILFGGLAMLPDLTGFSETFWLAILLPLACALVIFSYLMGYRSQKKVDQQVQADVKAWKAAQEIEED